MAEFGICLTRHSDALPPHAVAREAEARGLDAFYVPENSHVPIDRSRTVRSFDGIERLARFYDPFVTLSACAAVTEKICLGTSVCLLTQREPVATAHAVASLDRLAAGRVVLGVAGGFIREAMENHGSEFPQRWKIVRERVLAMRHVWRDEAPAFNGEFVEFGPLSRPSLPHRAGGPPVWIGSNSSRVPDRVAEYADGWMTRRELYEGDAIADLEAACAKRGRPLRDIAIALMGAPLDARDAAACVHQGYTQLVYFLGEPTPAETLSRLDEIAALAEPLRDERRATAVGEA